MHRLRSMPLPKTSPDMSPIPTTVKFRSEYRGREWKRRLTDRRRARQILISSCDRSPPTYWRRRLASPSQKPYSAEMPLAISEKVAVPLSGCYDECSIVPVVAHDVRAGRCHRYCRSGSSMP